MYSRLVELNRESCIVLPSKLVLSSPWLDISLSHTPPHVIREFGKSDYLSLSILSAWRDNCIGKSNPRDPNVSPFFSLDPLPLPVGGVLLTYGTGEVFAPVIEEWIRFMEKHTKTLTVIKGHDMPHSYPILLHLVPSSGHAAANRALFEISKFLTV